jgi:hypothetical protein
MGRGLRSKTASLLAPCLNLKVGWKGNLGVDGVEEWWQCVQSGRESSKKEANEREGGRWEDRERDCAI